jgi:hypothetical protein
LWELNSSSFMSLVKLLLLLLLLQCRITLLLLLLLWLCHITLLLLLLQGVYHSCLKTLVGLLLLLLLLLGRLYRPQRLLPICLRKHWATNEHQILELYPIEPHLTRHVI